MRLSDDFSKETSQARRDWQETFKVMKSKDLQPKLLYPSKQSLYNGRTGKKEIPRQEKAKGIHHHQISIT